MNECISEYTQTVPHVFHDYQWSMYDDKKEYWLKTRIGS